MDKPRRFRIPLVWIIPLVAALIGLFLAARTYYEQGPTITIHFKTGEGLEPGKTRIKFKDVDVGQITGVALDEDGAHVIATAKLAREAARLLVDDTRFWVVSAKVSGSAVSGLDTLLSGAYVGMDSGKSPSRGSTSPASKPHRPSPSTSPAAPLTTRRKPSARSGSAHRCISGAFNASAPDAEGWQIIPIAPEVAQARLESRSYGFYVIDDIGSEYTRDGNAVKFTNFVNRYVSSREDKRIHKPYFTLWLEEISIQADVAVFRGPRHKRSHCAGDSEGGGREAEFAFERRFRPRIGFDALFCRKGRNDRIFGHGQTASKCQT